MPKKGKQPLDPNLRNPDGTVKKGAKLGGGRPRGSGNTADMRFRILNELVPATIGGKKKRIPVAEATFRTMVQSALKGEQWAVTLALREWSKLEEKQAAPPEPTYAFSEADREMISEIYHRMKAIESQGR
jgi:hypothetical protein